MCGWAFSVRIIEIAAYAVVIYLRIYVYILIGVIVAVSMG